MQGFTKYFRYAILNRGECMEIIIGIVFVILILLLTGLDIGRSGSACGAVYSGILCGVLGNAAAL